MINSDQRSPNLSSEILIGQPDRRFDLSLPDKFDHSRVTFEVQVKFSAVIRS